MPRFTLSRRTLLHGSGGIALALPFLEIMGEGRARAAVAPKRYVVCYTGMSLTQDLGGAQTAHFWTPATTGKGYELTRDLDPLGAAAKPHGDKDQFKYGGFDVQDEVSIVSGLKIPWANVMGRSARVSPDSLPPGGKPVEFHGFTKVPLLSGMKSVDGDNFPGPTSDQIVAADPRVRGESAFSSLQYAVQASEYGSTNYVSSVGTISAKVGGGSLAMQASPRAAFDALTRIFPRDPMAGTTISNKDLLDRDISVLDHVLDMANRLRMRLGSADRNRLDAHLGRIRDLEAQIKSMPDLTGPACQRPKDPGPDPAYSITPLEGSCSPTNGVGWSGEDVRGKAMRELMFTALACDLTRVGSLMITERQSYLNAQNICGDMVNTVHSSGHYPAPEERLRDLLAWHVSHFAALVRMLKDTTDVDGSSKMIDNTILLMGTEGGAGADPEGGRPWSNHSSEGMTVLIAGGRNLGLTPGRHIAGKGAHPASVFRAAMRAVGVDKPLGDIDEPFAGL